MTIRKTFAPLSPKRIDDASSEQISTIYVSQRFSQEIEHFCLGFIARLAHPKVSAPIILVIAGPPGQGKSEMTIAEFSRLGISTTRLSASALSGEFEGDSIAALTNEYARLGRRPNTLPLAAIVIDDFDLSSARTDDRLSGTVNSALLNSFMMNIADNPEELSIKVPQHDGSSTSKVIPVRPVMIVLTVNDATQLYKPLTRPGRSRIFEWKPTASERAEIVRTIFPTLDEYEAQKIVAEFQNHPISFFAIVSTVAIEDQVGAHMIKKSLKSALSSEHHMEQVGQYFNNARKNLTYWSIVNACNKVARSLAGIQDYINFNEDENDG